jgi:hypothetical protein
MFTRALRWSLSGQGRKKKEVKLPVCLIKHYATKTYGGSGGIALPFLTSALDKGEWSASRSGSFTVGERAPGAHWIGGWVGPRAGLDAADADRAGILNWVVQPVACRYTDSVLGRVCDIWSGDPVAGRVHHEHRITRDI